MINTNIKKILSSKSIKEKFAISNKDKKVLKYLNNNELLNELIQNFTKEETFLIHSLILIDQISKVIDFNKNKKDLFNSLKTLVKELYEIEKFYFSIGGLIGYYLIFTTLLAKKDKSIIKKNIKFYEPEYIDIQNRNSEINKLIDVGIENLDKVAFVSPMGGAADRFGLINEITKEPMPLASLKFLNSNLLEIIINDLFALEYLYYKKTNKNITIPIVIMTSDAKNNHRNILDILEKNKWYHRGKENFYFVKQMLCPLICENKDFAMKSSMKLDLKPSGHGVIWKLMKDSKVFDSLLNRNINKLLIRQINNPIAYLDYNPLALLGYGVKNKKAFGFLSCQKLLKTKEGMNVLKEKKNGFYYYNFTNIEYTDFKKYNLKEEHTKDSPYSKYPSNTNILFADINEILKALNKCEFPGLIINLKTKVLQKENNSIKEIKAGRLESTMQNISDYIYNKSLKKLKKENQKKLKTFVLYNKREKTISAIKKQYISKLDKLETDRKCYYDILTNYFDLLTNHCNVKIPNIISFDDYLKNGPNFTCYINPILGPLYDIISKKLINGKFDNNFDLYLNIAELYMENIYLSGSLIIENKNLFCDKKILNNTKCYLKNIQIENFGIDKNCENIFYQNKIKRNQSLKIILNENSSFYANNLIFKNNLIIEIPKNYKITAFEEDGAIKYKDEKIK
ncbi:MAG: hypothetical protein K1060chlam5_00743 [Candidatus Anoxychlamydiales bacterium]|nr:hypothetical protein [Candidatus Anoxychlamydiales bacterium]